MIRSTPAGGAVQASVAAGHTAYYRPAWASARRGFGLAIHSRVRAACTLGIGGVGRYQWRESAIGDETTPVVRGVDPVAQSRGHRDG